MLAKVSLACPSNVANAVRALGLRCGQAASSAYVARDTGGGYDFASAGLPGLKATVTYLSSNNIQNAGADQQEWERDFRLDYTLQQGALKGLGFSWRNASLRSEATSDTDQNRLIASYSLPLL